MSINIETDKVSASEDTISLELLQIISRFIQINTYKKILDIASKADYNAS